ncbi:unnamed protein product [Toxocara canis]|uniref:Reverse transcriptase domain-containing protein n=1 Tax=Toxocara canis TaxID=6265 RepID=A0A183V2E4_TOXCA|nr:unnamed protein product [Toxocara canis]
MLKVPGELLETPFKTSLNNMIDSQQICERFAYSKAILLRKKRGSNDITNYHPTSPLSKVSFSKVLCKRLQDQFEQGEGIEQAGFGSPGQQLTKSICSPWRSNELESAICLMLVDYEKPRTPSNTPVFRNLWRAQRCTLQQSRLS